MFIVESADPVAGGVEVGLVADGVTVFSDFGTDLDAGVGGGVACDSEFEFEFEVVEFAVCPLEELVLLAGVLFGGLACDGAVFDGPIGHVGGRPAVEVFTVEDGFELCDCSE